MFALSLLSRCDISVDLKQFLYQTFVTDLAFSLLRSLDRFDKRSFGFHSVTGSLVKTVVMFLLRIGSRLARRERCSVWDFEAEVPDAGLVRGWEWHHWMHRKEHHKEITQISR